MHTYQWDAENHLKSVDNGTNGTFTYNAYGWRVYSSLGTVSFLYDPSGQMIGGNWANGTGWNAGIRFGSRLLAMYGGDGSHSVYFTHANALDSETQTTDYAGNGGQPILYFPYGQKMSVSSTLYPNTVYQLFAGLQLYDTSTDGYVPPARYYIPEQGRWLTPDPAGKGAVHVDDSQTWNMYAYVRNNPTTLTDPTGLIVQCSSSLNKKDAATCQSIIDTANQKDKNGNYVNPKLHGVYQRLNDDKRAFVISNAKLPGSEGAVFNVRQMNTSRTDFASGTIQIDFAKIRNAQATPADMVPGFTKYAGIAGDFGLKMAETFGHEGAHGVYALDNPFQAVSAQTLMNNSAELLQMGAGSGNPEFLREQTAIGLFLNETETYAQQTEQTINQELNGGPNE